MKKVLQQFSFLAIMLVLSMSLTYAQTLVKVSADTHIHSYSGNVDTNFGSNSVFIVKTKADGSIDRMGLVKLDFTSITDYNANEIYSVTFNASFHNAHAGTITLYDYSDDWTETGVTWNNAPTNDISTLTQKAEWTVSSSWNRADLFGSVDITDYFKEVMSGDKVMSMALVGENSDSGYDIQTKENTDTPIEDFDDWTPYVEITYVSTAIGDTDASDLIVTGGTGIINVQNCEEGSTVIIYDLTGKMISKKEVGSSTETFSVSSGLCIVKVIGSQISTSKVLVK